MRPEAIVEALAAVDPTYPDTHTGEVACALCEALSSGEQMAPADHVDDCPWRLAVEHVRAHPEPS